MATTSSLERARTYSSYGGSDIKIVIAGSYYGSAQAMAHAIQREKVPTYVLGSPDPRAFSRGKRGIAGTIVNLVLGEDPLYGDALANLEFLARADELLFNVTDPNDATNSQVVDIVNGDPLDVEASFTPDNLIGNYQVLPAWYLDQLPPVDAVLVAANEYGNAATSRVIGIEFLNTSSGFSVDDSNIEQQSTYVCIGIVGWKKIADVDWAAGDKVLTT